MEEDTFVRRSVETQETEFKEGPSYPRKKKKEVEARYAEKAGLKPESPTNVDPVTDPFAVLKEIGLTSDPVMTGNYRVPSTKRVFGKLTYAEFDEAICNCRGLITNVARQLGISVYYVKQVFAKYKTLRQQFEEYRDIVLDELEVSFLRKARAGDTTALIFALKCLGKTRGYVENAPVSQKKASVKMKIVPAKEKKEVPKPSAPADNVLTFKQVDNG